MEEITQDYLNGSSSDELRQAQASLWAHIFNFVDSMSLKCAVELGIPDAIHSHGNPISLGDLLSSLSISPSKQPQLRRLMRMLTNSGIFAENSPGVYSLTPVSSLLVRNENKDCLSEFAVAMTHPVLMDPFQSFSSWFHSDDAPTPFFTHHGCNIWGMARSNPEFNKTFNEGMKNDAKFVMSMLLKECRHVFEGIKSLVDVGGGTGSAAMAISQAFPDMKCSVLELAQVVSTIKEKKNVDFIAGDMFVYVPPANAVLLKWILHGWTDEECVTILKRCKEAIPSEKDGGKVIIIDQVMGFNINDKITNTAQLYFDTLMIVQSGGVEREEQEWKKIFTEAGFKHYKITPTLGVRSVIEVYP